MCGGGVGVRFDPHGNLSVVGVMVEHDVSGVGTSRSTCSLPDLKLFWFLGSGAVRPSQEDEGISCAMFLQEPQHNSHCILKF